MLIPVYVLEPTLGHYVAPEYPDRLVLRLEKLDGKFDHWRPAEVPLRNPSKVEKFSQSTLSNFENLARSINAVHA